MILLGLVAVLWVAVLAPSVWRRFGERQGVGSIDSFHHQLQLLEHAGPKTVAPAYRLHTALPGGPLTRSHPVARGQLAAQARPAPTDRRCDGSGRGRRRGVPLRASRRPRPARAGLPARRRGRPPCRSAGSRRAAASACCCVVSAGSPFPPLIIGLLPGMHLAWIFTALTGLGALALVALWPTPTSSRSSSGGAGPGARSRTRRGGHIDPATARATRGPGTTTSRSSCPRRLPANARSGGAGASRTSGRPEYPDRRRGCSSAGRALRSQCRGRGFESLHLHPVLADLQRSASW